MAIAKITYLDTDCLHPRNWNPNEMAPDKFNQLVEKIQNEGFTDPIKACPVDEEDIDPSWTQGKRHYWIWAGEHRWRVGEILEMEQVPVVVYEGENWDEYSQKLATVRDNFVHGEMNSKKFTQLVKSLDDHLDVDYRLFGFGSEQEMDKYLIKDKTDKEKSFLDGFLEAANEQKDAVDGLSDVVATLFEQCANTVDQSYLTFTFKGNVICIVLADDDTHKQVQAMISELQSNGGNINQFIGSAIRNNLKGTIDGKELT